MSWELSLSAAGRSCSDLPHLSGTGLTDSNVVGDRLAERIAARALPGVGLAELFVTRQCNHRCSYCFVQKHAEQYMSESTGRQAIDFVLRAERGSNRLILLLFGGEPMLAFPVLRAVHEYAETQAQRIGTTLSWSMTTNGTAFTEESLRWCKESGVKFLLSIDGIKAVHDRHRRMANGGSSFDTVMAWLPLMKRFQPWQGSRVTVHPDVVDQLSDGIRFLFSRGINQFIIGPATGQGVDWTGTQIEEYERQFNSIFDFWRECRSRRRPFRMTVFERNLDRGEGSYRHTWGCGAGRARVTITPEGDLWPCSKMVGLTPEAVSDFRLGDVWQGYTNLRARASLNDCTVRRRPDCAACDLRDDCTGGCPATNFAATGSIFSPPAEECHFVPVYSRLRTRWRECATPDGAQ